MYGADREGHRDLVDFCISKGANDWDVLINGAIDGGHRDLFEFGLRLT